MPLTILDPIAALVVVDLQAGVVGLPTVHPAVAVVDRSARLARAFRARRLPVVLVNVVGGAPGRTDAGPGGPRPDGWTELAVGLGAEPTDHRISKQTWGAFHGSGLDEILHRAGVTQVVLTGIATSLGVESTAREAHGLGYNVVLVTDAMTDLDTVAHETSLRWIFPRLGECTTTEALLARMR